jgi:peptidoglycan hydrolase CwlO-like protein
MSTITEIIIWTSPVVLAIACFFAKEVYDSFKGDIGDLKKSNSHFRTEQARFQVTLTNIDTKVEKLDKKVEVLTTTTSNLDRRTGDTKDLTLSIKTLETKLNEHESNYGKVILLLKKISAKLWPDKIA